MFEQNKGGGSSPQASNLAGLFQNAGSFMPQQVTAPQIAAPSGGMSKGTAGVAPTAGLEGMGIPGLPTAGVQTPQQAAAATAARIQALNPPPVAAAPVLPTDPLREQLELSNSGLPAQELRRRMGAERGR